MIWNRILGLVLLVTMCVSLGHGQTILSEPEYMEFHEFFFTGLKEKGTGNYNKALVNFEKAYQLDTLDQGTLFELSKIQTLLLAFDDAEYFAKLFLKKEPKNKWVLSHLSQVYVKQFRFDDAIIIQEQILEIAPKQVDDLILLYVKNKEIDKALSLIKKAEDNAYATLKTISLKRYLQKKVSSETPLKVAVISKANNIQSLRLLVQKNTSYASYKNLVLFEEKNHLYNDLQMDASKGLELYPAQAQLYLFKGIALNKLEKFNLAVETLMIGVDFVIENPKMESEFYRQLAVSYGGLNQNSQAKKFVEKSLKLNKKG